MPKGELIENSGHKIWGNRERKVWRPPPDLLISEWAESHRILTAPAEERGPMRLKRTPYVRPILDTVQETETETVVLCWAAQSGKSETALSVVGYYSHMEPCPIMWVLADEDTASYMNKHRVQPMLKNTRGLRDMVESDHYDLTKGSANLLNGASVSMAWASSVAKLASRPIRIIIFDEVDKPGYYVASKEAGPISLGIERTETFFRRKILIMSTPTLETGNIWTELQSCDVVFDFHVPCPYCGQLQPLRWSREYSSGFDDGFYRGKDGQRHRLGQVVWEGGRSATSEQIAAAGYECGKCGEVWTTVEKNLAVERGEMVPRFDPDHTPKKIGFHVNRLYSLLGKSGDISKLVEDFIGALETPKKLQGFVNSALAEPWKQVTLKVRKNDVLSAKLDGVEPQVVPENAVALTAGIDSQKFGFWFVVRAWARDYTSWLIHYGFLSSWADLEEWIFGARYRSANGKVVYPIWRAALDTGGGASGEHVGVSMTEEAYMWLRKNGIGRGPRIWGTKGSSSPLGGKVRVGKPRDQTPSGKPLTGGLQIVLIDTEQGKDLFFYRLNKAMGDGGPESAYLNRETGEDYVKQILAEQKRIDEKGVERWTQVRRDNHLLDAEVLCHMAADFEWPGGGVHLVLPPEGIDKRKAAGKAKEGTRPIRAEYQRPSWLDR